MEYQRAKNIRGTSFSNLMTDKLLAGQGVGSSLAKTISEKTKANITGIKEKFDILNVVKVLSGGSRLAPTLLGKLLGRKQQDLQYFGSDKKHQQVGGEVSSETYYEAIQVLGSIFDLLEKQIELNKKKDIDHARELKALEDDEESRNAELVKALTGRRKKKTKVEPEKKTKKKEEEPKVTPSTDGKKTTTSTTPKATTKAPAPKTPPTSTKVEVPKATTPTVATASKLAAGVGFAALAAKTLAKEEGFSAKAYWDPPGHKDKLVSIGYGHQIKQNEYKQGFLQIGNEQVPLAGERGIETKISKDQALKLKEQDLEKYTNDTKSSIGEAAWSKLSDEQKVALVSSTYNTGKGGMDLLVRNGLKDAILAGDDKGAAEIIRKFGIKTEKGQFSPALEKRRYREAQMFEEGSVSKLQPSDNSSGSQIDSSSKENKALKQDIKADTAAPIVNNNIKQETSKQSPTSYQSGDDTPAFIKKRRG